MGAGTGGMHFRTPHRARSSRQSRSFPDRDAPGLPAPWYLATFMCRPALKGFYSSGWHLHQSLTNAKTGLNLFIPKSSEEVLSPLGKQYLAGLLHHALASTVLANPTVNAYRRFRINSLAPDRAAWGLDHRGVLLRVLGGRKDPATRIENRMGEPSANPYLYIASQIVTGLDGVDHERDPGAPET